VFKAMAVSSNASRPTAKVRFEIAVSDDFVDPTIEALCEGARTGEVGDGKIFVVPLERAVRIRTGETDQGAVTPVIA
jgi:nitrogen regulatory protein P-II 1